MWKQSAAQRFLIASSIGRAMFPKLALAALLLCVSVSMCGCPASYCYFVSVQSQWETKKERGLTQMAPGGISSAGSSFTTQCIHHTDTHAHRRVEKYLTLFRACYSARFSPHWAFLLPATVFFFWLAASEKEKKGRRGEIKQNRNGQKRKKSVTQKETQLSACVYLSAPNHAETWESTGFWTQLISPVCGALS